MDGMAAWTAAMRAERWEEAWAIQMRSLVARDPATRDDPRLPYHLRWVWDGTPVDGRDVLVRCYHGLGDTIQFARFLPVLRERARSITLEVQSRLLPLLAPVTDGIKVAPFDEAHPLPPSECDLEITELDLALRCPPDAVTEPYLRAKAADLPPNTIAVNYGAGDWDRTRSVPTELLAPLCVGRPAITLMPEPTDLPVLNPTGCPFDLQATAALVAGAELVITVDTMIAHLAGALGRPTWLLLKHEPDWRWNPAAPQTPWYPTLRLYAQPTVGDWESVIAAVHRDLQEL
jgi:hypothetical protein